MTNQIRIIQPSGTDRDESLARINGDWRSDRTLKSLQRTSPDLWPGSSAHFNRADAAISGLTAHDAGPESCGLLSVGEPAAGWSSTV
jgi:hypothetical protein